MRRALILVPILAFLLALPACGGSGGGGDDTPSDPGAPGELRSLALQGSEAPDTGGGDFGTFPTFPIMDAATGGWCAFVAPVTGGSTNAVVYVALPSGTVTLVRCFAEGDAVNGSGRFINSFAGVWMCSDGTVIALANLSGGMGTENFALLAVDVDGAGVLSNLRTILLDEASLDPQIAGGVLSDIDVLTLQKEADETLWMLVTDSNGGGTHLVSIESDGTGLTRRASPGDVLVGTSIATIDAFGVSFDGGWYAFATTTTSAGRQVWQRGTGVNAAVFDRLRADGDSTPSGMGTIADAWKGGRILCYGDGAVAWVAQGTLSGADDMYLFWQRSPVLRIDELARVGMTAPSTGAGMYSSLDMLNAAPSAARVLFQAAVGGGTVGINRATFRVRGLDPLDVVRETGDLVNLSGVNVSAPYINLTQTNQPYDEVSFNGDFVYAQTWNVGLDAAIFWLVRLSPTTGAYYAVAAQGGPAPDGDTFGILSGGLGMTCAPGVVLFRAPVTMSGTGIFRQGP